MIIMWKRPRELSWSVLFLFLFTLSSLDFPRLWHVVFNNGCHIIRCPYGPADFMPSRDFHAEDAVSGSIHELTTLAYIGARLLFFTHVSFVFWSRWISRGLISETVKVAGILARGAMMACVLMVVSLRQCFVGTCLKFGWSHAKLLPDVLSHSCYGRYCCNTLY